MRNPWKKLMANVNLVATRHNGYGHEWSDDALSCEPRLVTVNSSDLYRKFISQNSKCYWFGIELNPQDVFKVGYPLSLSVDRLNNDRGYEYDNIVICSRMANLGRCQCDVETFKNIMNVIKYGKSNLFCDVASCSTSESPYETHVIPHMTSSEVSAVMKSIIENPNAHVFFNFE